MIKYEDIKPYIEKKLISEQKHPEDSKIKIFNYTQSCQFSGAWDEITMQCRGLIMNVETGEIIARPFPKFFNYQEYLSKGFVIPNEEPIITKKLDGSLGILYTLNGKTRIATRGSFTSVQALWATKWWQENKGDEPYGNDTTYLVEIIYPENRIVVNYDFSGVVHLASIDTETGLQVEDPLPVQKVERIANTNLEELEKMDEPNSEGFVVFYPKANLRLKIKFPEYVRLHKLITGVNEIAIWEHLKDGNGLEDLLEKVPDEFYKWVQGVQNELMARYEKIKNQAAVEYAVAMKEAYTEEGIDVPRKDKAIAIQKHMTNPSIGFALLDERPFGGIIWKLIRPNGSKLFKIDIDL